MLDQRSVTCIAHCHAAGCVCRRLCAGPAGGPGRVAKAAHPAPVLLRLVLQCLRSTRIRYSWINVLYYVIQLVGHGNSLSRLGCYVHVGHC
jgi:hypothetical protein